VSYKLDATEKGAIAYPWFSAYYDSLGKLSSFTASIASGTYNPSVPHSVTIYMQDLYTITCCHPTFGCYTMGKAGDIIAQASHALCADTDGDGYSPEGGQCGPVDCNDSDPAIHPGALELCGDFKDNSCNLFHSQNLFTTTGIPLSTSLDLAYASLNVFSGSLGKGWTHSYEMFLITGADGSVYFRKGDGAVVKYLLSGGSYHSPAGDFSTLVKNADNSFTINYRSGLRQQFDPSGRLTGIVDRYNNSLTLGYSAGDLMTVTDSAQRVTTFSYDTGVTPHRLISITDPDSVVYTFQYQNNRLWKVVNPITDDGEPVGYWEYTYNADGLLQTKKDPSNNLTRYDYYPDLRMKSAIDPEGVSNPVGRTRTLVYNDEVGAIKSTTFTEKDGGPWTYLYDTVTGLLKQKTDPYGNITSYAYYPDGSLKAETVPHDGSTRLTTFYSYDQYGNLLTRTDPVDISIYTPAIDPQTVAVASLASLIPPITTSISSSYDYSDHDQIISITDHRGSVPTSASFQYYLENGLLVTKATDPDNHISYIRRNPNGTVKELVDANEKTTSSSYSATGLLEAVTTPDGGHHPVPAVR
jgi:YD repeat-containing protein